MQVTRKRLPKFYIELSEEDARKLSDEAHLIGAGALTLFKLISNLRETYYAQTGEPL